MVLRIPPTKKFPHIPVPITHHWNYISQKAPIRVWTMDTRQKEQAGWLMISLQMSEPLAASNLEHLQECSVCNSG
jgi:hypothetical protein